MKRDIELHKTIEGELAKKFHKCQKIIKNLNDQAKDKETELREIDEKNQKWEMKDMNLKIGTKTDEEMVNLYEYKLKDIESKMQQTQ